MEWLTTKDNYHVAKAVDTRGEAGSGPLEQKCFFQENSEQKKEREEMKKSDKKWHKKEGVQSKKWYPSPKFFCVLFSVTQSFVFSQFSWSSDNITASNKKNTSAWKISAFNAFDGSIEMLKKVNILTPFTSLIQRSTWRKLFSPRTK